MCLRALFLKLCARECALLLFDARFDVRCFMISPSNLETGLLENLNELVYPIAL